MSSNITRHAISKHIHRFLLPSITSIFLLLSSSLYADEPPPTSKTTNADYHKLCNFYKEITSKPVNMDTKEVELVVAIYDNLPDLYNELYKYIANADPEDRYSFIKKHAKYHNKLAWECEAAKQYYINDFKKDK
ncbi:hypothetical protein MNBD_GAMMA10-513 [hydrothermal vent metagenome]|uniref:Uncharacterized protein n=1 Tax=hydrothermal vent metagenome TaxID=652676 RepID=A0A3B0Y997_9ZZZZ